MAESRPVDNGNRFLLNGFSEWGGLSGPFRRRALAKARLRKPWLPQLVLAAHCAEAADSPITNFVS
jgi:hypothetical protein